MSFEGRLFGGRYRADRQLGKGGFGVVFRAADVNTGRDVAVKVLSAAELSDEARRRFTREAQVVQRLSHPNTVRLFDFGTEPDGTQFIVYELLEGETLSAIIRRGKVSLERTVHIGAQLLKALSEAHQLGVVHRDIKPANVMLVQFAGDRDVVKLLDFGIAKPMSAASTVLTMTGSLIGTPRFMSPEQVNGSEIRPSSDIYSLALVLAEMMTGARVLDGPPMEVMMSHLSPEPVPLDPLVLGSPLGGVLRRALEKDPARRHQSALEMLAAMEAAMASRHLAPALEGTERAVHAPVAPEPPALPAPRRILSLLLVAAVAVALVLLGGVALGGIWYLRAAATQARPTQAGQGPAASPATPTVGTSNPDPRSGTDAELPLFDRAAMSALMKAEGWTETGVMEDEDDDKVVVGYRKGTRVASLSLIDCSGHEEAKMVAMEKPDTGPTARFGRTVAIFAMRSGSDDLDVQESRAWRDRVVKSLREAAKRSSKPAAPARSPQPLSDPFVDRK